jgi:hypothetical protein
MDQHNISNHGTLIVVELWPNWITDQKTKSVYVYNVCSKVDHRPQASASKSGKTTNAMVRGAT